MGAWNATYEGQIDSHLMVAVTAAVDCIVAAWKIDIDTKLTGGSSLSYTHTQPIYVLFNPWCLNDSVYMPGNKIFYQSVLLRCIYSIRASARGFISVVSGLKYIYIYTYAISGHKL